MIDELAGAAFLVLAWSPLAVLTAVGGRRRGSGWLVASVCGVCFPVTWVHWYVVDERASRHA